ncbi:MAG: transcription antitermination factor NusB, partial [Hyphomicrobiaceae bacterium]
MTAKSKPKAAPGGRSLARMAAVQALYQMDIGGTDLNAVIREFETTRFTGDEKDELVANADTQFFADILRGVVRRQRDIDPIVDDQLASGWRLVRVDSILRAILRAGVFELQERRDVPARVVINEYIEVAHAFFADEEPKVVNGILDRIARRMRPAEFQQKDGARKDQPAVAGGVAAGAPPHHETHEPDPAAETPAGTIRGAPIGG